MRVSQNLDFFQLQLPLLNFFPWPLPFRLLSLPSALNILSGCRKNLGANYGQNLEMVPRSIIGTVDHFTTIFAPKRMRFSVCYVRMPLISKTDCCSDRSILAQLSAYQEYLVTFKLMTSQVVQRARPIKYAYMICVVGVQRVNNPEVI